VSAAVFYFLFAIVAGQGDTAALTTLGEFTDLKACAKAQATIEAALKTAQSATPVFCVSGEDLAPFAKAAHSAE
jgi:hypothetical protein